MSQVRPNVVVPTIDFSRPGLSTSTGTLPNMVRARRPPRRDDQRFPARAWVDSRRTDYRLGRLSAERVARLESEFPDWRWNVRDAMFETGLVHFRRYVAVHGTSYIRQHESSTDSRSGSG